MNVNVVLLLCVDTLGAMVKEIKEDGRLTIDPVVVKYSKLKILSD